MFASAVGRWKEEQEPCRHIYNSTANLAIVREQRSLVLLKWFCSRSDAICQPGGRQASIHFTNVESSTTPELVYVIQIITWHTMSNKSCSHVMYLHAILLLCLHCQSVEIYISNSCDIHSPRCKITHHMICIMEMWGGLPVVKKGYACCCWLTSLCLCLSATDLPHCACLSLPIFFLSPFLTPVTECLFLFLHM